MKRRSFSKRKGWKIRFFGISIPDIFSFLWCVVPFVAVAAVLAGIGFGVSRFLISDPLFQVASVKVFPRGILSSQEYARLERACKGKNLLTLDLRSLDVLLKGNPRVKSLNMQKRLPQEVEIWIIPRNPLLQLRLQPNGPLCVIDEDGVVMSVAATREPGLVELSQYDYPAKKLSVFEVYRQDALRKVPELLRELAAGEVTRNETIERIAIDRLGNVSVFLSQGPELRLCASPLANLKKADVMKGVLSSEERKRVSYLDLCLNDVAVGYH